MTHIQTLECFLVENPEHALSRLGRVRCAYHDQLLLTVSGVASDGGCRVAFCPECPEVAPPLEALRFESVTQHDVKALVRNMAGLAHLLGMAGIQSEDAASYQSRLQQLGERTAVRLRALEDLIRVRGATLRMEDVDLSALAARDLTELPVLTTGGLRVRADQHGMEELFRELFDNAALAGASKIWVEAVPDTTGLQTVRVVHDGSPPTGDVERWFEPFRGTWGRLGVGLTRCAAVVTRHGGSLRWVEDARGAALLLQLPRAAG